MNYFKILRAAVITAAAMMAFAGTASATTVTSPSGTAYTGAFSATSTNSSLHGSFITISCAHSAMEGKFESHGASATAEGKLSALTISECNYPFTVKKAGSVALHATGNGNGTFTWTGAEIALHTSVGECILTTNGTDFGTLTGGTNAKLDIDSAAIPRTGGSFFCGSSMEWTGNYTFNTPASLVLD